MIRAILACDNQGGISKDGVMPWPRNSEDLKHFKSMTTGSIVVMGRRTWEADDMPTPLPGRVNIVITRDHTHLRPGFHGAYGGDINKILPMIQDRWGKIPDQEIWLIGGAKLIHDAIYLIDEFYLSRIQGDYYCDTHIDLNLIDRLFEFQYTNKINPTTQVELYRRK